MAQPPKRHADDRSRTIAEPLPKNAKTEAAPASYREACSSNRLTRKAVKAHNRCIRLQQHAPAPLPPPVPRDEIEHLVHALPAQDLALFASNGGPDLSDVRRPATKSTGLASNSTTTTSKRSAAYSGGFALRLTDHNVYPVYSSQKPDLTDVRETLAVSRASLSPSAFSEGAFAAFWENNARAKDADDVLANVIPTILGPSQPAHASARKTVFDNLETLVDGRVAPAVPDIYYGAYPEELRRPVRDALNHHIMPSTMQDKPLAPSFFVAAKGPDGSLAVAMRQARYHGAMGARAMHSLQNYGEGKAQYDGKAYTFSSIYHGGQLQLYDHHPTTPATEGGRPAYLMTQVMTVSLTNDRDAFVQGATILRNARDVAKQHRDGFMQAANARAL